MQCNVLAGLCYHVCMVDEVSLSVQLKLTAQ